MYRDSERDIERTHNIAKGLREMETDEAKYLMGEASRPYILAVNH